jgi:hypothetical protein
MRAESFKTHRQYSRGEKIIQSSAKTRTMQDKNPSGEVGRGG